MVKILKYEEYIKEAVSIEGALIKWELGKTTNLSDTQMDAVVDTTINVMDNSRGKLKPDELISKTIKALLKNNEISKSDTEFVKKALSKRVNTIKSNAKRRTT